MEGFTKFSDSTVNAAPVGGRRRRSHKLRMTKKKTVRKILARMGRKMRGGEGEGAEGAEGAPATEGGRRHRRSHRRTHRHRKFLGMF